RSTKRERAYDRPLPYFPRPVRAANLDSLPRKARPVSLGCRGSAKNLIENSIPILIVVIRFILRLGICPDLHQNILTAFPAATGHMALGQMKGRSGTAPADKPWQFPPAFTGHTNGILLLVSRVHSCPKPSTNGTHVHYDFFASRLLARIPH